MAEQLAPYVWLPAVRIETIGQEALPTNPLPLRPDVIESMEHFVPWQIQNVTSQPLGETALRTTLLVKPSEHHGRSSVVDIRHLPENARALLPSTEPLLLWQDEHGNPYSSLSYKGNVGQNIQVQAGTSDPRGLRFHGLQTTYALERCLRASRLLREQGVDTEYITGAYLPELIPHENRFASHDELRQTLYLEAAIASAAADHSDEKARMSSDGFSPLQLEALETALRESRFVVTSRAMLCSDRLLDIASQDAHTSRVMLNRAIHLQTILGKFQSDDKASESIYEQYLGTHLPRQLGAYVCKMHELGLAHRMLHLGNITATGGIVDLDSVIGPAIGLNERDEQITQEDIELDLGFYLLDTDQDGDSISSLFRKLSRDGILPSGSDTYHQFLKHFYEAYTAKTLDTSESSTVLAPSTALAYIAASFSPELSAVSARRGTEVTMFEHLASNFAIEALDKGMRSQSLKQNSLEDIMDSVEFDRYVRESALNWLRAEPNRPLHNFDQLFASSTTTKERNQALNQLWSWADAKRDEERGPLHRIVSTTKQAYRQYHAEQPQLKLNRVEQERIAGRDLSIVGEQSLIDTIKQLTASELPITDIVFRQYFSDTDEGGYDHFTDHKLEDAPVIFSNLNSATFRAKLYRVHASRVQTVAEDLINQEVWDAQPAGKAFRVGRARRVFKSDYAESDSLHPERHSRVALEPEEYVAYLVPAENGWSLYVESYDELPALKATLASTRLRDIPFVHDPLAEMSSMQLFASSLKQLVD